MVSLVRELEQDAYNSAASLSNMLRKAKAVAVKLQLQQPIEWVEAELNGYGNDEIPNYRMLIGQAMFRNPLRGWRAVMFESSETERAICECQIRSPVREIEHMLEMEGQPNIPLTGQYARRLCEGAGLPVMPISIFFSRASFASILEAVRNKVLDWSLSLQAAGITGEGMSFRPEERAKVSGDKGHTYNIGSIGNFAGNLGGQVGGGIITAPTQNIGQELEKVAALVAQLRMYQDQLGLSPQQQGEISRHVDALDEELRGKKPKPGVIVSLLSAIKTIAEGAATNLAASGILYAISTIKL